MAGVFVCITVVVFEYVVLLELDDVPVLVVAVPSLHVVVVIGVIVVVTVVGVEMICTVSG